MNDWLPPLVLPPLFQVTGSFQKTQATQRFIVRNFGNCRVVCISFGLLLILSATGLAQSEKPQEKLIVSKDGDVYANETAKQLVEEARKHDPLYCRPDQRDRDKAVLLYKQAMDAQPGAKCNAVIANRIAQLYAFYEDKEKKVFPIPSQAGQWWTRCLELTSPNQSLWAEAQMGLASMGAVKGNPRSAMDAYDKILNMDVNQIEAEDWKYWSKSDQYKAKQELERERLRNRVAKIKIRAKEKKSLAEKQVKLIERRQATIQKVPKEQPRIAGWTFVRMMTMIVWGILITALICIIIVRRRKQFND